MSRDQVVQYEHDVKRCDCGEPLLSEEEIESGVCSNCSPYLSDDDGDHKELNFDE